MATTITFALVSLSILSIINPSQASDKKIPTMWECIQVCIYRGDPNGGFKCMISQLTKDDPVYKLCAPAKDQDHVCSPKRQLATGTCCCYSKNCNKDMATCRSGSMTLFGSFIVLLIAPLVSVMMM